MGPRAPSLHISALSPAEYATYVAHLELLQASSSGTSDASSTVADLDTKIDRIVLRHFAIYKLNVSASHIDHVLHLLVPSASPTTQLESGQVFAVFRLLAHSSRQPGMSMSEDLVFVPTDPIGLSKPRLNGVGATRRASAPPQSLAFTEAPLSYMSTSTSTSSNNSNNPFRLRHTSQTYSSIPNPKPPPPLPPRKPSRGPSLPPRKPRSASSSQSQSTEDRFPPTSISTPSALIRDSLQAADRAQTPPTDPTIHVIRRSESAARIKQKQIKTQVAEAVRLSEPFDDLAEPYRLEEPNITLWSCTDVLSSSGQTRYAMIILNQPIQHKETFVQAWNSSAVHLCADGGANRLYDLWDTHTRLKYLPSMIKGDLDSIRSDVKAFYKSHGVRVVRDPDQYSTDLMKCIKEVEKEEAAKSIQLSLLLVGGLSGRIDQTVHTMSLLHKLRTKRPQSFVLSSESLAWVLDTGSHLIDIDHGTMGETCGILPVGIEKAMVTTKGLKWNLDWETSFDGDISTSNHLLPSEPVVYLKTSHPVLWCIEVKNFK